MPFHTVDPFKNNNPYKNIGNRSKNDLNKQKTPKSFYKNKKNKQKIENDFIIKQTIKELKTLGIIGNSIKAEFTTIEKIEKKTIDTNKNIKKIIEPTITKILETYDMDYIPSLLII
jgi:hypothetical protein